MDTRSIFHASDRMATRVVMRSILGSLTTGSELSARNAASMGVVTRL